LTKLAYERIHANLKSLSLTTLENILDNALQSSQQEKKSVIEVLDYLLDEEVKARKSTANERRFRMAKFPARKSLDDFDLKFQPSIDANVLKDLRSLRFLHNMENVLFLGPPGVGKTHLAIGLGMEAVQAGFSTLYANMSTLIELLRRANRRDELEDKLRRLTHPRLLILDEVGYLPLDKEGSHLFFQLISRRYETASTIFTSNKPFSEWGEVLGDSVIASAVLDRILHHSTVVNIKGESYRLKAKKRAGAAVVAAPAPVARNGRKS
jgi:DNA replication protein DnaC